MKQAWKARGVGILLIGGIAAASVWADEVIEMATYIPAPGASGNPFDRLHAKRATIGDPYSLDPANPAEPDPPNGTLLVSGKVGIGTAAPEALLDANGLGRFQASGPVPASGAGLELYYVPATEGLIGGWVSSIDRGTPAYKDLFLSSSSLLIHTSGSERMRVDSGGKVGIGTASPMTMLHVRIPDELTLGEGVTLSGPVPRFALVERWTGLTGGLGMASFEDNYGVGTQPGDVSLYAQGGGRLRLATTAVAGGNATVRMTIDATGKVGIGTASPATLLDVNGVATVRGQLKVSASDTSIVAVDNSKWTTLCGGTDFNGGVVVVRGPAYGSSCEFYSGSPANRTFMVASNGVVSGKFGTYHPPSDLRLKKGVVGIPNALEKIGAMRGVRFRWKDPEWDVQDGRRLGLVAQEVERVVPEVVHTAPDGIKAVDFNQVTAVLVQAVKELKARDEMEIGQLRAENAALKKRVEALERDQRAPLSR